MKGVDISMSNTKFIILLASTVGAVAVGTTVIYYKIDVLRHNICRQMGWMYKDMNGQYHDLI